MMSNKKSRKNNKEYKLERAGHEEEGDNSGVVLLAVLGLIPGPLVLSAESVQLSEPLRLLADLVQIPGGKLILPVDLGHIPGQEYSRPLVLSADLGERMGLEDPLVVLGDDITGKILSYLDASSLGASNLVSRGWQSVASIDTLWSPKCDELWIGKAHIPRSLGIPGLSKLSTYSLAITDSKRARISRQDLCDHAWDFHFTKGAPEYWRFLDPYWGTGTDPLMRRHFHSDGSQSADPGDKVWGGHESCYCVVTGLFADGEMREHYVRINRSPQLSVSRRLDWGWDLSNELVAYSSLPDSHKRGGTGPSSQLSETLEFPCAP